MIGTIVENDLKERFIFFDYIVDDDIVYLKFLDEEECSYDVDYNVLKDKIIFNELPVEIDKLLPLLKYVKQKVLNIINDKLTLLEAIDKLKKERR